MKYYKGFTKDLKCRDFQFEEGKSYEETKAKICNSGFHACEIPLDVFKYYSPGKSRFHEVELDDIAEKRESDKVCAKKIKIGAEIKVFDLISISIKMLFEKFNFKERISSIKDKQNAIEANDNNAIEASDNNAIEASDNNAIEANDNNAIKANYNNAIEANDNNAIEANDNNAIKANDNNAIEANDNNAIEASDCNAIKANDNNAIEANDNNAIEANDNNAIKASDNNAITTGNCCAVVVREKNNVSVGKCSVVLASKENNNISGNLNSILAFCKHDEEGNVVSLIHIVVDGVNIKANTFYTIKDGEFVEVEAEQDVCPF